jgi:two-component system, cell cycle sensor histidine kinase and response regulator CckA
MLKDTMKLLLIEDDEDDVVIAQDLLAEIPNHEFDVTWINDYDDALFSMISNQYDIILLDYRLGQYNGIDLLKEANQKGCEVPVILLTGQDDYDIDVESMNAGASDYHVKGRVDVNNLERSIRYAIDRKRSEADLKQSEEKFRSLTESAIDGVLTMDSNGQVVFCNKAAESIFDYKDQELLSVTIDKLVPGISLEKHQEKMAQVKGNGDELIGKTIEVKGIKKNGDFFPAEVSLSSWEARDGQYLTAFLRDVSKRKGLEQRVRQVQKMEAIGTLAGGIAHDFNNILGSIMGYTEMAIEDIPAGSFTRNYLENVITASERAKELVGQILTFSRLDEQEKKSVRVDLVVKETLKLLRASIPATINIIQNVDTEDSFVLGDTNQIHQLVLNLCTNASHAMQTKGKGWLYINLREQDVDEASMSKFPGLKPGRYVQLEVADTGHGIEKSVISRIFDPFFTTKNVGEGTGMGLAVVHGIVKNLGGEISVESQVDKGTTFRVFLPCVNEKIDSKGSETHVVTKGNERILFVDDESSLVEIASTKLRELGYTVHGKTKSKDALVEFTSNSAEYDLVITDYSMPVMTGIELAKEIYKKRPELPVILCTGYSDAILEKQARKLGVRALVNKPIRTKDLPEVVRRVLDKSYIEEFVVL